MTNKLFEEQLRNLRMLYIERLQNVGHELETLRLQLAAQRYDSATLHTLRHVAHGLSGSGASYGFTTISETAGRLDRYVQTITEHGIMPTIAQRDFISVMLDNLLEVVATEAVNPSEPMIPATPPEKAPEAALRRIVIFHPDQAIADDLARQVANFGYGVRSFYDIAAMRAVNTTVPTAVLVADISYIDSVAQRGDSKGDQASALIIIAQHDNFATRLRAVRAGSAAFFTSPIDVAELIDVLDALTTAHQVEPYRILIIDDEEVSAETHAAALRKAGMIAAIVTNPLKVMSTIQEFQPDVLLLDIYMPDCTGIELATVLRQQPAYVGTPIVFLSAETQVERQMEALRRGGDDFLTKSIQLDHLVAAVTIRANRARLLRTAMVRDSLTGLYNHTSTKEHLKRELLRAGRQARPLTFAMIDIDRFKSINDSYGHVVGDHVIKSLARLLQQRLRKSDIIGRYGGEEFAVLLPDTEGDAAFLLLEELRERFANVHQYADNQIFSATMSCGFACFPERGDAAVLVSAADRALYEAKRGGRNRVVRASVELVEDQHQ